MDEVETKKLFLLEADTLNPRDIGIETELEPKVTQVLAKAEITDRQSRAARSHDFWVEFSKYAFLVIGTLILAYFGFGKL